MNTKLASLVFAVAAVVVTSNTTQADQFVAKHGNKQVVVHTNPLPVFLHRAVPPNYGRHVTLREYKAMQRGGNSRNAR